MKNYVYEGRTIEYTNEGGDLSTGDPVVVGNLFAVAAVDIPSGESGVLFTEGVYELPAVSGAEIAQGETLVWDVSAGAFDDNAATPAVGDLTGPFAIAWESKTAGVTKLRVKLTGAPADITAGGG